MNDTNIDTRNPVFRTLQETNPVSSTHTPYLLYKNKTTTRKSTEERNQHTKKVYIIITEAA
jgi:hypothetical protein